MTEHEGERGGTFGIDLPNKVDGAVGVERPRRLDRAERHVAELGVVRGVQEEDGSGVESPQRLHGYEAVLLLSSPWIILAQICYMGSTKVAMVHDGIILF